MTSGKPGHAALTERQELEDHDEDSTGRCDDGSSRDLHRVARRAVTVTRNLC